MEKIHVREGFNSLVCRLTQLESELVRAIGLLSSIGDRVHALYIFHDIRIGFRVSS